MLTRPRHHDDLSREEMSRVTRVSASRTERVTEEQTGRSEAALLPDWLQKLRLGSDAGEQGGP